MNACSRGGHTWLCSTTGAARRRPQWRCFRLLWPRVRAGGVYIVEDIEDPATFFSMGDAASGFGMLVAAASNECLFRSAGVQRARDAAVRRADESVSG